MKGFFRRLHWGGSQDDHAEGGSGSENTPVESRRRLSGSFSDVVAAVPSLESRALSSFPSLLNDVKSFYQGSSSKHRKEDVSDQKDEGSNNRYADKKEIDREVAHKKHSVPLLSIKEAEHESPHWRPDASTEHKSPRWRSDSSTEHKSPRWRPDASTGASSAVYKDAQSRTIERVQRASLQVASDQAFLFKDEELQIRVALALSVHDDPEATAIESAKDRSRGSEMSLSNTTAEVLAYRYWKYNVLNYDDKVVDGFYDVYGVASDLSVKMIPDLIELQETRVLGKSSSEVILVNRPTDKILAELEEKAISMASNFRVGGGGLKRSALAHRIAVIVADHMGGPVNDEALLHKTWRRHSAELRVSSGSIVLPLGCLQIGLGRHRALLFKVLADAVGIPCQLLKGKLHTGSDKGAVNIVKVDTGREYIIDLMGAPGALLSSDLPGMASSSYDRSQDEEDSFEEDMGSGSELHGGSSSSKDAVSGVIMDRYTSSDVNKANPMETHQIEPRAPHFNEMRTIPARASGARSGSLWRSLSWREGPSSPTVRDMKGLDASQFMWDAAKDNPVLAQRLHDVLVESGVKTPRDLFGEISPKRLQAQINEEKKISDENQGRKAHKGIPVRRNEKSSVGPGRSPAPVPFYRSSFTEDRRNRLHSVEGLGERRPLDSPGLILTPNLSASLLAPSGAATVQSAGPLPAINLVQENLPSEHIRHAPVAAAAAATAAVVASSMVAAASKAEHGSDPNLEVPVAAALTATAAVIVAIHVVVGGRMELPLAESMKEDESKEGSWHDLNQGQKDVDAYGIDIEDSVNIGRGGGGTDKFLEGERVSDKSSGSLSTKSVRVLEEVDEWEIPMDDLVIGDRIGIGSFGEVYRGDWHGTEVAVKKFLDQDISGDVLEEFRSEIRLMKRMRHPNLVLFMGAVTRPPNLSIVTEFLPRGSLYRLIHRSNGQIDERRRIRMALDVARGMNHLHTSTPVIVHRDLKTPNLLVDKNWVVKICDFGLSRIKLNTFLSSKSSAGTPEWMAPEVLRNEPCNEKSDVYSFGVVLWELATLKQPWAGMNPMQVVGAVGFQQRRLDIPENMDPVLVEIIRQCWQSEPALRPTFAAIMTVLKLLDRPITQVQSLGA